MAASEDSAGYFQRFSFGYFRGFGFPHVVHAAWINAFIGGVGRYWLLIAMLAEHPNIVSLKDTSDMIHTCKTVALTRNNPDFTVF